MRAPEDFATLAADFRVLTARQRRDIVGALTGFEQAQLSALLQREDEGRGNETPQDQFGHFSSWLADRLRTARDEESGKQRSGPMTEATRDALLNLTGNGFDAQVIEDAAGIGSVPQRSLMGALGSLFSGRPQP